EIWATDSPSSERSGDEMTNPTPDTRTDAPGGRPDARTDASNDAGADARATASAHTGTPAPAERLLIVRLAGEFTIKSRRTQQTPRRTLVRNLRDALDSTGEPYELDAQFRHLVVRSGSERAPEVLTRVFGVSGISVVEAVVAPRLDEIVQIGRAHV